MNVKAEAYQEYNQAAVIDRLFTTMPDIVRALASPLANVDKITIVSTGNGDATGMNKITGGHCQDGGAGAGAVRNTLRHAALGTAGQGATVRRQTRRNRRWSMRRKTELNCSCGDGRLARPAERREAENSEQSL